jgi:Lrp/AsnC family transcriptional regulator, regulator for asnA, asnC and gidA
MIDEMDRNIIKLLNQDGRASYTRLANKLGIEEITVTNRIRKLMEDEIIAIRAVTNPVKMGIKVMACIGLDVEISMLDSVCTQLVDIPSVHLVITMFGKFDVLISAEYRDIDMLYNLVRETLPNIKGIKAIETFLICDDKNKYQVSPGNGFLSSEDSAHIDEIDENLINELRKDGRTKYNVLARKYGISSATVARRINALVKNNVIRITLLVNHLKLRNYVVAYLGLQTDPQKTRKISELLYSYSQVYWVITLMNGYSILTIAVLPDLQSLWKFVTKEISSIDGVQNIETLVQAEFKKGNYMEFDLDGVLYHL